MLYHCIIVIIPFFTLLQFATSSPNFVVFFADDVGYGDLHAYGHPTQERGGIEKMFEEGMKFTNWYSADSMCSPSRAALLTGRLPVRMGIVGPDRVFWQLDSGGLPKSEKTIAENLRKLGYATGIVGKWHLGINEKTLNDGGHLPHHHGFEYEGTVLPYGQNWKCDPSRFSVSEMVKKCFKYVNGNFVQQPITLENLTHEMVADAKYFIKKAHDNSRPFFLYLPLIQAHCSLFCDKKFCGKSKRGLYGDNINEMAWAVDEVLNLIKSLGIKENTLAFFTSDNGPQLETCSYGGTGGVFQGGKASTWEGGIRMPAAAWWPGTIPAGSISDAIVSTMDIYPTIMHLAGHDFSGEVCDGMNIHDILVGQDNSQGHDILFNYCSDRIMAARYRQYKVHFHTQNHVYNLSSSCENGKPVDDVLSYLPCYGPTVTSHDPPLIFHIDSDPGEMFPLDPSRYETLLQEIHTRIEKHSITIDPVPSILGLRNPELQPCCNPPNCVCNYPDPKHYEL